MPSGARSPGQRLAAGCLLLAAGCAGPRTELTAPDTLAVYVDGSHTTARDLPFRYYGVSAVDATPADQAGAADFGRRPARFLVETAPPASPWLFPLDLPLEVLAWLVHGQPPTVVAVEAVTIPADQRVPAEFRPLGIEAIVERAHQARSQR